MAEDTPRYTVLCEGTQAERAEKGLRQAVRCARELGKDVTLLVHALDQVTGSFGEAIGMDQAKALRRDRQIAIADIGMLKLKTVRDFNRLGSATDVLLGMWATSSMIDHMESEGVKAAALVVVPWLPEESETWEQAMQPIVVGEGVKAGDDTLTEDALLHAALKCIERQVDPRHRMHGSEKKAAVELLRHLKDEGYDFPERFLETWARREGWAPKAAMHLEEVGQAVRSGKRIQLRGTTPGRVFKPNIIEILRQQIAEEAFGPDDGAVH